MTKASKIQALIDAGATTGERSAAREAMARFVRAKAGQAYRPGDIISINL